MDHVKLRDPCGEGLDDADGSERGRSLNPVMNAVLEYVHQHHARRSGLSMKPAGRPRQAVQGLRLVSPCSRRPNSTSAWPRPTAGSAAAPARYDPHPVCAADRPAVTAALTTVRAT